MSEVLGFVLVFALITGTVGIVYASGTNGLAHAQHAEKVTNVERAFDVLADSVQDIYLGGAPSRATEVKLAGGSLSVNDTVTVKVRAEKVGDSDVNATYATKLQPIVYDDTEGNTIVYADGAVLRAGSGGAVMLRDPKWVLRSDRSVVPLVNTYGTGSGIAGSGSVLIVTDGKSRELQQPFDPGPGGVAQVDVTVTSPRVGAWKRFFEDQGLSPVDPSTDYNNVTYRFTTDRLYVTKTGVEVQFER